MRAMQLPAVGAPLHLTHRPIPKPATGEVLIEVTACGVCGSDLFLQDGGFGEEKLPVVPGHEASGLIAELGDGVTGWRVGDQVALYYIDFPENGRYAKAGRPNIGPEVKRMGVDVDGAFAEYVVRPAHTLVRVPAPVAPEALAVLTDAVATPYHALVRIAQLRRGETLVVLGIGGIGSNAVQLGRIIGAQVVAVSRSPAKLELARTLGASLVGTLDEVRAVLPTTGADVVLQCSDSAALDAAAVELAGYGGRVVFVGASREAFRLKATTLIWRELALLGSRGFTPTDIECVIALYLDGSISVDHLTSSVRPLEDANEAFADLRSGTVFRSVLIP